MLTLRMLFLLTTLATATVIYTVYADPNVKIHVTKRLKSQPKTDEREVISAKDNDDGTVSVYISACGSLIEAVLDRKTRKTYQDAIERAVSVQIAKECK